jgi:hypothetical protein
MIIELAALTSGFAIAALAVTVGAITALVRLLRYLDLASAEEDGGSSEGGGGAGREPDRPGGWGGWGGWDQDPEPDWWPEFESEFAEYNARSAAPTPR